VHSRDNIENNKDYNSNNNIIAYSGYNSQEVIEASDVNEAILVDNAPGTLIGQQSWRRQRITPIVC